MKWTLALVVFELDERSHPMKWIAQQVERIRERFGQEEEAAAIDLNVAALVRERTGRVENDEHHFFAIPDRSQAVGYALYGVRRLPTDAPLVNDLEKTYYFHAPSDQSDALLRQLLTDNGGDPPPRRMFDTKRLPGDRMIAAGRGFRKMGLAISAALLLMALLVALGNKPLGILLGIVAFTPGFAGVLMQYLLKVSGENTNKQLLQLQWRRQRENLLRVYKLGKGERVTNALLRELEVALNTSEAEYDPIMEFDFESAAVEDVEHGFLDLTCKALAEHYRSILESKERISAARLGPEEVRWLRLIREISGEGLQPVLERQPSEVDKGSAAHPERRRR